MSLYYFTEISCATFKCDVTHPMKWRRTAFNFPKTRCNSNEICV